MVGWLSRLFSTAPSARVEDHASDHDADQDVDLGASASNIEPVTHERHHSPIDPRTATRSDLVPLPWMQRDSLNADFLDWLFDAPGDIPGEAALFASQQEKDILVALEKIIDTRKSGADMVRRMPGVLPQLLQSLRTDEFSGADLARKISHDVVLVEAVIRLANSALYRSGETITSIEHAIMVLGHDGLRQLVTSVAFKPIVDLKSGRYTRALAPKIWEQSEKCAIANRIIAEGQAIEPLEAFLAGLIQHVGFIVSLRFIDQMTDEQHGIGSTGFRAALSNFGRKISANIAREWKFADTIILAIEEQGITSHKVELSALGTVLGMGEYVSKLQILSIAQRVDAQDPLLRKGLPIVALALLDQAESNSA